MNKGYAQLRFDDRIDKKVSLIIALQVTLLGVKNVLVQGFPFLFEINTKLNILNLSIVTFFYIYSLKLLFCRKLCHNAVLFNAIIFLTIVFTLLVFPQNSPYLMEISLRWIVVCFITGYMVSKLRSFLWLQKYLLGSSYFLSFACFSFFAIVSVIGQIASNDNTSYSLSMSYVALWAVMWQLHSYFKYSNKLALIFGCITIFVIIMYGSRNPLLAIAFYVLIQLIDTSKSKSSVFKWASRILLGLTFFFAYFWKYVVICITTLFDNFGLSSRTVGMFYEASEGEADITSGRNEIHDNLINLIFDHPVFGMGIGGDATNMHEIAHSLYLSIYSTYGLFFGTFFLFLITRFCFMAMKKSQGLDHQILVLFMCMVFPRGFTGGDIWESDVFWWLMGIVFMILSNSRRMKYAKFSNNR